MGREKGPLESIIAHMEKDGISTTICRVAVCRRRRHAPQSLLLAGADFVFVLEVDMLPLSLSLSIYLLSANWAVSDDRRQCRKETVSRTKWCAGGKEEDEGTLGTRGFLVNLRRFPLIFLALQLPSPRRQKM
jgi:hypothetical protein